MCVCVCVLSQAIFAQLYSSHTLAKEFSKLSKPGFNSA